MCEEVIEEKTGKKGKRKLLIGIIAAVLAVVTVSVAGFFIYNYVYLQEIPEFTLMKETTGEAFNVCVRKIEGDKITTSVALFRNNDDYKKHQKKLQKIFSTRGRELPEFLKRKDDQTYYFLTLQKTVPDDPQKVTQTIYYFDGYLSTSDDTYHAGTYHFKRGKPYKCYMDLSVFFDTDDDSFDIRAEDRYGYPVPVGN